MDKYTKAFIVASLLYLLVGSLLGLVIGINDSFASFYFTHVHFNLLGFMAMMIYGVGYFILPRFNARTLKWPGLVPWHFYTANLGLLGMCLFRQMRYTSDSSVITHLFALFAAIEVVSIFFFVLNMASTLASAAVVGSLGQAGANPRNDAGSSLPAAGARSGSATPAAGPRFGFSSETRVGEILERMPESRMVLANMGIRALANEMHAEQVKKMPVTLGHACMKHGVDIKEALTRLDSLFSGGDGTPSADAAGAGRKAGAAFSGNMISGDMAIGTAIAEYPATKEVFLRYFGSGCFDCPGQTIESIQQGAMMHNVDEEELVRALNEAVSGG